MKLKNKNLLKSGGYIDGRWVNRKEAFEVLNPATGKLVGKVSDLNADDTAKAIKAAHCALKDWSAKTAKARAEILLKWHDLMLENITDLAKIMTAEQGKPLAEAEGEIKYAASFLQWFAEEGKRAYGDVIPTTIPGARMQVIKQPVGVCAAITPWNFPSAMITRKVAPALAAGCTIVLKPAELTPLSALALSVLGEKAGVPAGVFNLITTSDSSSVGKEMCANPLVRKITFTGSTRVGKILTEQAAGTMKKVSMELGGNAPFIVFEDADIDAAVEGAIACKFRNAGQTCVSANRIYIHRKIYKDFTKKFVAKVKQFAVGDGAKKGVVVGPLITVAAMEKARGYIDDAKAKGAKVECGGAVHALGGSFLQPTVLSGMKRTMAASCEEIFGPVAPLYEFKDDDEVIKLANDTQYGLASYFYTNDLARATLVSEALEYGMVAINAPIVSSEAAPFGGVKESGLGREGSKYGLDEFLEVKYVLTA